MNIGEEYSRLLDRYEEYRMSIVNTDITTDEYVRLSCKWWDENAKMYKEKMKALSC